MIGNKKGMFGILYLAVVFMIIITIGMFYSIFIYEVGGENIIAPLTNTTLLAGNSTGISAGMSTAIEGYEDTYNINEPPWDVFFILIFLVFFISSIIMSLEAKKEGTMGFFGIVTIGMIVVLLVFGFMEQVTTWLVDNLIIGTLEFDMSGSPFMNFYYNNLQLVTFFWVLLIIIVNQFDLDILDREGGRVQP